MGCCAHCGRIGACVPICRLGPTSSCRLIPSYPRSGHQPVDNFAVADRPPAAGRAVRSARRLRQRRGPLSPARPAARQPVRRLGELRVRRPRRTVGGTSSARGYEPRNRTFGQIRLQAHQHLAHPPVGDVALRSPPRSSSGRCPRRSAGTRSASCSPRAPRTPAAAPAAHPGGRRASQNTAEVLSAPVGAAGRAGRPTSTKRVAAFCASWMSVTSGSSPYVAAANSPANAPSIAALLHQPRPVRVRRRRLPHARPAAAPPATCAPAAARPGARSPSSPPPSSVPGRTSSANAIGSSTSR